MVKAMETVIISSRKAVRSRQHNQRGPAGIGSRVNQRAPSPLAFSSATVFSRPEIAILSFFLRRYAMVPFFVQFKCKLDQSYGVANALAEAEIAYHVQGVRIEITAAGIGNKPQESVV